MSPQRRLFLTRSGILLGASAFAGSKLTHAASALGGTDQKSPYIPDVYKLVFADEFDDITLDRFNENASGGRPGAPAWRSRYKWPRKDVINEEKQIYVDAKFAGSTSSALGLQPFSIRDGILTIRAQRSPPDISQRIWNFLYTSGVISSELTHWQTYGYFEMRARMPRGKGYWPAFWLLPKGSWPPEIDIFEMSGAKPTQAHFGVIEKPAKRGSPGGLWLDLKFDVTADFHVYGLEWTETNIVFFVDGEKKWEYGTHKIHGDMYIAANLALGSKDKNWIPDPDQTTPFPGDFDIDYIRSYQRG